MESGNSNLNYQTLGWPSLEERRLQSKLTILQKARLNLLDLPLDKIQPKTRTTRFGGDNSFARNFSPVNGHFYSYYPQTTQLWNHLPLETRSCSDIDTFSVKIRELNLVNVRRSLHVLNRAAR